ncbi:Ankyrin repeat [Dillenia turbinata]|uniref:Ankyrin repeat n=1 Tax=Dillenia turbinata TaxID=194707 RepID=A0AAN8VBX0_9MAGN
MEKRLHEAAVKGSVETLLILLNEDEHILDRFIIERYRETPLHIAAMLGHVDFSKEILARKPELAAELDYRRSSPLHLAAAKGYVELVKALISVNPDMCLVCDRDGRNPLHLAAINGRVDVLKELARIKPQAARLLVDHGENILHLCVLHNQLDALKCLVEIMAEHEFVNSKDDDGNTILHLAVAEKQIEAVNYLLFNISIEVNAENSNGLTALDILSKGRRDMKDREIGESLYRAQAQSAKNTPLLAQNFVPTRTRGLTNLDPNEKPIIPTPAREDSWEKYLKRQDDWVEKKRSALMVVASLIATMAFQAGLNPPSGVWQDTKAVYSNSNPAEPPHDAGSSVMAYEYPEAYSFFLICNTIGLISSLSIILLLISGLPIRRRFFVLVLMVIMWVAITSMALTYVVAVLALASDKVAKSVIIVTESVIVGWAGLMGLLILAHFIRLIVKVVRKLRSWETFQF